MLPIRYFLENKTISFFRNEKTTLSRRSEVPKWTLAKDENNPDPRTFTSISSVDRFSEKRFLLENFTPLEYPAKKRRKKVFLLPLKQNQKFLSRKTGSRNKFS